MHEEVVGLKGRGRLERGSTLVEMVMVMTLFVLFGLAIYTLIFAGSETQQRIMEEKDAQIDARIALSYINVRLRQNDKKNRISIQKNAINGRDSIVISRQADYDVWIFWVDGKLMEFMPDIGQQPQAGLGLELVELEGFHAEMNEGVITSTVVYRYHDEQKEMSNVVYLRSASKPEA